METALHRLAASTLLLIWLCCSTSGCAWGALRSTHTSDLASEDQLRSEWRDAIAEQDVVRAAAMRQRLAAFQPTDLSRRLAVADSLREAGLPAAALRVCDELIHDPALKVHAIQLKARVLADGGEALSAAEQLELLAGDLELPESERRSLWQSAAELREEGGDLAGAVRGMEQAFAGMEIRDEDQHLLDRLHAYQTGEFRRVGDAMGVLARHQDEEMRLAAAEYLCGFREQGVHLALADALSDASPAVVETALRHLIDSEEALARDAVVPVLDHPSAELRTLATRCLGQLGEDLDAQLLVNRLDVEDRSLFRAQCAALERLTGEHFAAPLGAGLEEREAIAEAWRAWWQRDD